MLHHCCILGRSVCKRKLIFICKINLLNKNKQTIYLMNTRRGKNLQLVCPLLVRVMNRFEEKTASAIIPSALNSLGGIALKKPNKQIWGASEKEGISSLCKNRKSHYLTRDGSICLTRTGCFLPKTEVSVLVTDGCWHLAQLINAEAFLGRICLQHLEGKNLSIFGTIHCFHCWIYGNLIPKTAIFHDCRLYIFPLLVNNLS